MAKAKELNIIICGVGGQGVVLMSEFLGNASVNGGLQVKGSEVLGMAQRGGSVFSNLRLGSDAYAPLTPEGKCDVLIAVEPSEALRNMHYLTKDSVVVLNTREVKPFTFYLGKSGYPSQEAMIKKLKEVAKQVITLDATELAQEAGSAQSANVVMLGALYGTGLMPINDESMKEVITGRFKGKVGDINIRAFDMGCEAVRKQMKSAATK
jgi:indolepyruvate ferredoxin oxidoreductase beta subunit